MKKTRIENMLRILFAPILVFFMLTMCSQGGVAWSNGGWSADPLNPDYGTHDLIASKALSFLPSGADVIVENETEYLYGTELADHGDVRPGYDTANHHVYFDAQGACTDDASAKRAAEEYNFSKAYILAGDRNVSFHKVCSWEAPYYIIYTPGLS